MPRADAASILDTECLQKIRVGEAKYDNLPGSNKTNDNN